MKPLLIKNKRAFEKILKKGIYQVFIFSSPCPIPFSFILHTWIVTVNENNKINRWDVLLRKHRCKTSWEHLHLNFLPPFKGTRIIPFVSRYHWKGSLLGFIEGNEKSLAKKIIDLTEGSKKNYPYYLRYSFTGPNSNTFTQWALDYFPGTKIKLPWNAIGKNYPKSKQPKTHTLIFKNIS